jgi:hypothetical protein
MHSSCWSGRYNLVYGAASNIPDDNHPQCRYVGGLFPIVGKSRHLAHSHLAKDHQRTIHDGEGVRIYFCTFSLVLTVLS